MQGQFQHQKLLRFDFSIIDKKQEIVQNAKKLLETKKNLLRIREVAKKIPSNLWKGLGLEPSIGQCRTLHLPLAA